MKILLRTDTTGTWLPVESAKYSAEKELQDLLQKTPSLISLEELHPGSQPLYAAVSEFGVSTGSIDLLAFNVQGDIAIVECKLASNPDMKRLVIGQVLEYAANLWNMSYEQLDEKVKAKTGQPLAALMQGAFSTPDLEEVFRDHIKQALETGQFILIIVVDEITEELARIVNYLNICGKPAFSLGALEMQRYKNHEIEMLVPHVLSTPKIKTTNTTTQSRKWDETSFFQEFQSRHPKEVVATAYDLYQWSLINASNVPFGSAPTGSFMFHLSQANRPSSNIFCVYTNGFLTMNFVYMENNFSRETIETFRNDVASILSYPLSKKVTPGYFSVELKSCFAKASSVDRFKQLVLSLKTKFKQEAL